MSKQEELMKLNQKLRESVPDITGMMIATTDGLTIATDFPEEDATKVAAVCAAAWGLGNRVAKNTTLGDMVETMIKGRDGQLLIYVVGGDAVLAVRTTVSGNLGLIRLETAGTAKKVASILAS
jgi:predicted regulator of Ras-like GTPase activity (Roadblock/LC7/MglB family)